MTIDEIIRTYNIEDYAISVRVDEIITKNPEIAPEVAVETAYAQEQDAFDKAMDKIGDAIGESLDWNCNPYYSISFDDVNGVDVDEDWNIWVDDEVYTDEHIAEIENAVNEQIKEFKSLYRPARRYAI